ncbi:amidohydrolase family protein [Streptomyces sp. NPDC046727]|uniref:amidohydrolase family protein n=1 Tax=Streptomyces sp. NPDC046727 TaxID=3155373 RepID=UPI00340FFA75
MTDTLALTGALLIDGTGRAIQNATVLVDDNRIAAVGPEVTVPAGADVVDLTGKTLMPGLIDAHVHLGGLGFGVRPSFGGRKATDDYARPRLDALRHGVTTQRSLGDFLTDTLAVRDDIEKGALPGARIVTSGPSFQVEGGHPNGTVWGNDPIALAEGARLPGTPADATRMVAELADAGVDLIKIIISDNAFMRPPQPELKMDWAVTEAIVKAAHEHALRVAAHAENVVDALKAVLAGVDDIEHLVMREPDLSDSGTFEKLFSQMAANGTYLVPTMTAHQRAGADVDPTTLTYGNKLVKQAFDAGVRLGVGSDAHSPGLHGWKLYHELVMLVHDQGIPALTALTAATGVNAELLGISDRVGTVTPGKLADLVVVDGNPLDDITAIGKVDRVWRDGRLATDPTD